MDGSTPNRAVFAVTDIFFMSKIEAALPAAPGLEPVWLKPGEDLAEVCRGARPGMVVVDLQDPVLHPMQAVQALKAAGLPDCPKVIGFLPHVRMDLREAANRAGVDQVLTRSAFTKLLPRLLAGETLTAGDS